MTSFVSRVAAGCGSGRSLIRIATRIGAIACHRCAFGLFVAFLLPVASAQRVPPHLGFAYPAGGQQGTTITVSLGGQNLANTTQVHITGSGVTAKIVGYDRPMTPKELNDVREKIQALVEKRAAALGLPLQNRDRAGSKAPGQPGSATAATAKPTVTPLAEPDTPAAAAARPTWTPADQKILNELRALLAARAGRQANPAIAETVKVELAIRADAAPGDRELRLQTPNGLSNPIIIQIGQLPEFTKPVVTATTNAPPPVRRQPNFRPNRPQPSDPEITLPVVVNGQILPGEVDRYRFAARHGQHLTVAVSARALLPYLADAVPGWFQATLALYDPQGHEVAYADSFRFSPDPVVSYEIPADGTYAIEIKDSIYRGREDFVYRIAIGELPYVTSIFPLGANISNRASIELSGWNLPSDALPVEPESQAAGVVLLSVGNRGQLSNAVRFALDHERSVREVEPNDRPATAQPLRLPVVVDGRIQSTDDEDVYRIDGKAGQPLVAEVFARRLGSPLDSTLRLTDGAGRQLAFNDDYDDQGSGLLTHHADSRISTTLPADGVYFLRVTDAQHHGGPEYGYRLRIGAPHPDFELRVVPSSINARAGAQVPLTVYALRHDGFAGEIVLAFDGAPRGFSLSGARIPTGQDKVQLTMSVPPNTADEVIPASIVGAAMIDGRAVAHAAAPADDMMQAFAYHHLVVAKQMLIAVGGPRGASIRWNDPKPLKIPAGGSVHIAVFSPAARTLPDVTAELGDPTEGITLESRPNHAGMIELTIATDSAKTKPGFAGNLIVNLFGQRANPNAKGPQRIQRWQIGTAPALPFEIVAPASLKAVADSN